MPIKILQLSDLHLLNSPADRLHDVPTRNSFHDVWDFIQSGNPHFDAIIFTGDLTHNGDAEMYALLKELLGDWLPRCRVIPGNHDSRSSMRQAFGPLIIPTNHAITFSLSLGGWRLIGLDSLDEGNVSGHIEDEQLVWLEEELASHADEPTILFVHHPPIPVNSEWLDAIGLREPDGFVKIVEMFNQVKIVSAGHVHHVFEGCIGDAVVCTTPSTAIQFQPQGSEPIFDAIAPGYRIFDLDGNDFRSEVIRLPKLNYPPTKDES